jgi:hypothetical protein
MTLGYGVVRLKGWNTSKCVLSPDGTMAITGRGRPYHLELYLSPIVLICCGNFWVQYSGGCRTLEYIFERRKGILAFICLGMTLSFVAFWWVINCVLKDHWSNVIFMFWEVHWGNVTFVWFDKLNFWCVLLKFTSGFIWSNYFVDLQFFGTWIVFWKMLV